MILELVRLRTHPEQADAFAGAVARARPLLAESEGFLGLEVRRCIEEPDRFVLLIQWRALSDHTEGFRGSSRFGQWREILGPFYREPPEVLHYAQEAS